MQNWRAPEIVRPLKSALGELKYTDYHDEVRRLKANKHNIRDWMKVIPVSFMKEHIDMLAHTKRLLDAEALAVSPTWNKLIVAMRTAYAVEGDLKKKQGSYDDLLDAFMLSLKHF